MPPKSTKPSKSHKKSHPSIVASVRLPQLAPPTIPQICRSPFAHFTIQNFLPQPIYSHTVDIYSHLQFKQKSTDLFNFFQTEELNAYKPLDYFKECLDQVFWQLEPMKKGKNAIKKEDTFYSIFASYYFQGNYLLCHDDVIEDRKYAFSYYLEDHDSGDLVLFDYKAEKQMKRIKVKKNTLAVFQVSDISYHQVDYTKSDGRKAITGWFNIKGLSQTRTPKSQPAFIPSLPSSPLMFPLESAHISQQYFQLMDIQYQFNLKPRSRPKLQGPFFSRRVHRLSIDPFVVFQLPGYRLYSADVYEFQDGDYVLLNDGINQIEGGKGGQGVIDVFVTGLSQDFQKGEEGDEGEADNQDQDDNQNDLLVKIYQEGHDDTNGIPEIHDSLFVVHRGKKKYYIDRCTKRFNIAHFIYIKQSQPKNKMKKEVDIVGQLKNKKQKKESNKTKKIKKDAKPVKNVKRDKKQAKPQKKQKAAKLSTKQKSTPLSKSFSANKIRRQTK